MPVPAFGPRMVCTRCGIVGANARPNCREQPAQLSGAGTAPWRWASSGIGRSKYLLGCTEAMSHPAKGDIGTLDSGAGFDPEQT
jgi:hypothetical protein